MVGLLHLTVFNIIKINSFEIDHLIDWGFGSFDK